MIQLGSFLVIAVVVIILMFIVSGTMNRVKKLEDVNIDRGIQRMTDYNHMTDKFNNLREQVLKETAESDARIAEIDRAVFVPVDTDNPMRFDERVSIGRILGKFMEQAGYRVRINSLDISKNNMKGESYGKKRAKTVSSRTKKKKS